MHRVTTLHATGARRRHQSRTGSALPGSLRFIAIAVLALAALPLPAQVLDKRAVLERQSWWDNRDFAWFAERIPMFESPDTAIDATYYYRWELVTKHLVYGSAETGYTLTEFIDRPFWSGAYGAISCPLGHQLDEIRWLNDRRIIEDFARYWFETPGAEPRSYSNWYGAAVWGAYQVLGDTTFLRRLLPYMKRQYDGWLAERWDPAHRMFKWDGLHDGMERSITSRQTDDIDAGAVGFRPTLNTYLFADAMAIAQAHAALGDSAEVWVFALRADSLRQRVHEELWDERRGFFLHQFAQDEKDGVKALSRTYETGRYAGDPHGRELIGYVPWQFNLPEPSKGYERAWRFLMDTAHFLAPFGPTTTERHDPQFYISPRCCWWSGNSWPYATSQTLTAMANLLNDYRQDVVSAADWMTVFDSYTRTHRKQGRPYIAEAAHPDNGAWEGFDTPYHSEHYFHSTYVNLVITGLVGLRPRADDTVEVNPLAPASWPYFALDDVPYHGRRVSVIWDRDGSRYGRGQGLLIVVDDSVLARSPQLGRLTASIGPPRPVVPAPILYNLAVNNGRGAYPWVEASSAAPEHPPSYLVDGSYWYHREPANRWTTIGSANAQDTLTLDFGAPRRLSHLTLYVLDDAEHTEHAEPAERAGNSAKVANAENQPLRVPRRYDVQVWRDGKWVSAASGVGVLHGRRANVIFLPSLATARVRVILTPQPGSAMGLTELEAWSPDLPGAPTAQARNLAFGARATASYTFERDRIEQVNDMQVAFTKYSRNRWTSYRSPNASDWIELDFAEPKIVSAIEVYLFGDDGGIQAPRGYTVQVWDGAWRDARVIARIPEQPLASARNVVRIAPEPTSRIRILFEHALPAFSGVTEIVVR